MLSKTSEYAIRALGYLAQRNRGSSVGIKDVSQKTGLPAAYIAKIFRGFTRAKVLSSQRGIKGGFAFRSNPSSLTLYDVIRVTENLSSSPLTGCMMGLKTCSGQNPCALHPVWMTSRKRLLKKLKSVSIQNISKSLAKRSFRTQNTGGLSNQLRPILKPGAGNN